MQEFINDRRAIALSAHTNMQAVWGKKKASHNISQLEPAEIEAYALDFAVRLVWDLQRNKDGDIQCGLSAEDSARIRSIVKETLPMIESLTSEFFFDIPDPVAVAERERMKAAKGATSTAEREERQKKRAREKQEREERMKLRAEQAKAAALEESAKEEKAPETEEEMTIDGEEEKDGSLKKSRKKAKLSQSELPKEKKKKRAHLTTTDISEKKKKRDSGKKEKKDKSIKKKNKKDKDKSADKEKPVEEVEKEVDAPTPVQVSTETVPVKIPDIQSTMADKKVVAMKRFATASKPGLGRPPGKLTRGGNIEEAPLPTITMKMDLVNVVKITDKIEERIREEFPDPMAPSVEENRFLDIYHKSIKGPRPANEDEYVVLEHVNELIDLPDTEDKYSFVSVYDGHNGKFVSLYTRGQLHHRIFSHPQFPEDIAFHDAFVTTDKNVNGIQTREGFCCGSTALAVCIKNNKELIVGNVGDCRGFLCRGGEPLEIATMHSPAFESEKKRITDLGGAVVRFGTWRVNGILAVSRSIGDHNLSKLVIADPDVTRIPLCAEDEFLILASDGLWDGIEAVEMIKIVKDTLSEKGRSQVCNALCEVGLERKTNDNVTVVAVFFNHPE